MNYGVVVIDTSFDDKRAYAKALENGDFKKFFDEEGEYLDNLVEVMEEHGNSGDEFTITYRVTVTVEKEERK